jgi:hypothetical protein
VQLLAQFLKLVSHRNSRRGGVGVQILQTLSIMIQVRPPRARETDSLCLQRERRETGSLRTLLLALS